MHVVSWRARGLRLREIRLVLALAAKPMLPSHVTYQVGISIYLFEAQYPAHQCPCLRFDGHLAVHRRKTRGQDGSLLLSCRALSSPTTCRFIPVHKSLIQNLTTGNVGSHDDLTSGRFGHQPTHSRTSALARNDPLCCAQHNGSYVEFQIMVSSGDEPVQIGWFLGTAQHNPGHVCMLFVPA